MLRRSRVLLIGGFFAATLVVLTVASAIFCEATLHVPRPPREPTIPITTYPGAVWRLVTIRARDHAVMEAWFVGPGDRGNKRCVLVLHGIADSRTGAAGFATMFLSQGYSVLLPDSRAHGRSGGEFVTYGLLEKYDVLGWTHWLRGEGCRDIYGLGESLGASILIQASALGPDFRAVVAECPYADLRAIAEYRIRQVLRLPGPIAKLIVRGSMMYARWRYGLDFAQVELTSAMSASTTPILLIHGLNDTRTPPWHSQKLVRANPKAVLWLVPNADHVAASTADPGGFRARVLGWFAQHRPPEQHLPGADR